MGPRTAYSTRRTAGFMEPPLSTGGRPPPDPNDPKTPDLDPDPKDVAVVAAAAMAGSLWGRRKLRARI